MKQACPQRIEAAGALASYARLGNLYDNAPAEAGWSTLETELLPDDGRGCCRSSLLAKVVRRG